MERLITRIAQMISLGLPRGEIRARLVAEQHSDEEIFPCYVAAEMVVDGEEVGTAEKLNSFKAL